MLDFKQQKPNLKTIRWLEPHFVAIIYLFFTVAVYSHSLWDVTFDIDTFSLISGEIYGRHWRFTQTYILHKICLPLFGENLIGYRLPSIILHIANSLLVYYFFILTFHTIKSFISHSYFYLHIGGVIAGFLFLIHGSDTLCWTAALCYQLVVFFSLLTLIFALLFFRSGFTPFWFALVITFCLALYSHIYSLALPVFVGLLEISLHRKVAHKYRWSSIALRYLPLVGLFGFFVMKYNIRPTVIDDQGNELKLKTIGLLTLHFSRYLVLVVLRFWHDSSPTHAIWGEKVVLKIWHDNFDSNFFDSISVTILDGITLIILCILFIQGLREIFRRNTTIGVAGVFTIFFIAWNGLAFLQTMSAYDFYLLSYRYYFNAVGFSMVAAYGIIRVVEHTSLSLLGVPRKILFGILIIGLPISMLVGNAAIRSRLLQLDDLIAENLESIFKRTWAGSIECQEVKTLTLEQVRQVLQTSRKLECKNLRKLDLSNLIMSNTCLYRSNLYGAKLSGVDFKESILNDACLLLVDLRKADLRGANLENADLKGSDLREADLRGANLKKTDLLRADLREADLRGANLENADLRGSDLREADLRWTTLIEADLIAADLSKANLRGVDLRGIQFLTPNQLSQVKTLYQAKLDPELEIQLINQYPHLLENHKKDLQPQP